MVRHSKIWWSGEYHQTWYAECAETVVAEQVDVAYSMFRSPDYI
jgi:hypothetical protein